MEHATPSYVELNVLKLLNLFRHEIAKLIYKILQNNHPPNFSNFFIKQIESTIEQLVFYQTNMHYTFLDTKLKNCRGVSSIRELK